MDPRYIYSGSSRVIRYALRLDGSTFLKSVRMEQRDQIAVSFCYSNVAADALRFCTEAAALAFVAAIAHHGKTRLQVVEV